MKTPALKKLRYALEAMIIFPLIWLFQILGLDVGGEFGAALMKKIGPRTAKHKMVKRNLARTYPNLNATEIDARALQVWDNMGRIVAEYCNIGQLRKEHATRIKIENADLLEQAMEAEQGLIVFSAHMGNWEALPMAIGILDLPIAAVSRRANNPFFDNWAMRRRKTNVLKDYIPKGKEGAKMLIARLKQGQSIAMLTDQKLNQGVESNFLGRRAMSPSAPATMARKYNAKLMMMSCERLEGSHFKVTFHPAFAAAKTDNMADDIQKTTDKMNDLLSAAIHKNPAQWLWLHNRWARN